MFFEDHLNDLSDVEVDLNGDETTLGSAQYQSGSQGTLYSSGGAGGASSSSSVQLLIEATENERRCPDVLPYPNKLLSTIMTLMAAKQVEQRTLADEERQQAQEQTSGMSLLPFKPSDIMALELQRLQFFLCELLRCRLRKIQNLCTTIYYEGMLQSGEEGVERSAEELAAVKFQQREHLSLNECIVADRLALASHRALLHSGLQAAPEPLQHLVPHLPHGEGPEILPEPDMHTYVFGVALQDLGVVELGEGTEQEIPAGEVFLMPYRTFRPYVLAGQVRLI